MVRWTQEQECARITDSCATWIKYTRCSWNIYLTLCKVMTWDEWWMSPVIFQLTAGNVSLKPGTLIPNYCSEVANLSPADDKMGWQKWKVAPAGLKCAGCEDRAQFYQSQMPARPTLQGREQDIKATSGSVHHLCAAVSQLSTSCSDVGLLTLRKAGPLLSGMSAQSFPPVAGDIVALITANCSTLNGFSHMANDTPLVSVTMFPQKNSTGTGNLHKWM